MNEEQRVFTHLDAFRSHGYNSRRRCRQAKDIDRYLAVVLESLIDLQRVDYATTRRGNEYFARLVFEASELIANVSCRNRPSYRVGDLDVIIHKFCELMISEAKLSKPIAREKDTRGRAV